MDIQLTQDEQKKLMKIKKKVEKLNLDIKKYFDVTGEETLPDIESTVMGYSQVGVVYTQDTLNGFKACIDDEIYYIDYNFDDGEIFLSGEDLLDDAIKYLRRRLRKAWRILKSENPDKELEKDND